MNRVTHLFVAKDVATGNDGHVAVRSADGVTILGDTDTLDDDPYIFFEQEIADGTKFYSPPIYGAYVTGWSGTSYTAPVAQVSHVGNVGSGTLDIEASNETEYTLSINVWSDRDGKTVPWSYKYVTDTSATSSEIADAFVTGVNASAYLNNDYVSIVAAKTDSDPYFGISLTGGTGLKATSFEVSVSGGFGDTTVAKTTKPDKGSGSSVEAAQLEKDVAGYLGYTNQRMEWGDKFNSPPAYVVAGETYDVYVLDYGRKHDEQYINTSKNAPLQVIILVPAAATTLPQSGAGGFETGLNVWLASCPGNFAAVTL